MKTYKGYNNMERMVKQKESTWREEWSRRKVHGKKDGVEGKYMERRMEQKESTRKEGWSRRKVHGEKDGVEGKYKERRME